MSWGGEEGCWEGSCQKDSGVSQTQHSCIFEPEMQRNLESQSLGGLEFWRPSPLWDMTLGVLHCCPARSQSLHLMSVRMS